MTSINGDISIIRDKDITEVRDEQEKMKLNGRTYCYRKNALTLAIEVADEILGDNNIVYSFKISNSNKGRFREQGEDIQYEFNESYKTIS